MGTSQILLMAGAEHADESTTTLTSVGVPVAFVLLGLSASILCARRWGHRFGLIGALPFVILMVVSSTLEDMTKSQTPFSSARFFWGVVLAFVWPGWLIFLWLIPATVGTNALRVIQRVLESKYGSNENKGSCGGSLSVWPRMRWITVLAVWSPLL